MIMTSLDGPCLMSDGNVLDMFHVSQPRRWYVVAHKAWSEDKQFL